MQTTGIFTLHNVTIPVKRLDDPIYLIPFGDIHRFSQMCHVERWKEFLDWAKKKPRCLFLGMGDYDDIGSSSERKILLDTNLHDSTTKSLEKLYSTRTDALIKEIGFMDGSLIGLMEGNHYGQYGDGTTTTQRMCQALSTKYLGVSTFIRLSFCSGYKRASIDIWAHHGKGAARLVGGSINRVQQMGEAAQADIYIMGHDHKKGAVPSSKLYLTHGGTPNRLALHHRKQLYIRSGSFLKGYEENEASYVADGAMNPTDLGVVKIEMTPRRGRKGHGKGNPKEDSFWIDLHASV